MSASSTRLVSGHADGCHSVRRSRREDEAAHIAARAPRVVARDARRRPLGGHGGGGRTRRHGGHGGSRSRGGARRVVGRRSGRRSGRRRRRRARGRKSTRLNSSHANISYAVFCLKKKKK